MDGADPSAINPPEKEGRENGESKEPHKELRLSRCGQDDTKGEKGNLHDALRDPVQCYPSL